MIARTPMLQPQVGFKYAMIFIILFCVLDFENLSTTRIYEPLPNQ